MRLPDFDYHEPGTLEEACRVMGDLGERARPIAGGTDLLVNMKKGKLSPPNVVSLGKVKELRGISWSDDLLQVGACSTAAFVADSQEIASLFRAVGIAAGSLGSPLIRNLATIGGNLVTARPAADLPPALMACHARVILKSDSGERRVSMDDFFLGPGLTVMKPDEILTRVLIERPPPCSGSSYIKLGKRRALEISIVSVAAFVSLDETRSAIRSSGIVLGAVAPKPLRARSAEELLAGEQPCIPLFREAGEAAARDSMPIDDFRGSADYRRAMVAVLTERALTEAVERAMQ
ncbi:MAG: xanthine dehydrogenase family protein subunit M [Desulfatiglandales bacterium]